VIKLARAPGTREQRWAHLLCGPVDATQAGVSNAARSAGDGATGNSFERIEQLEAEVAQLRATVEKLCLELGMSPPGQS